MADIIQITNFVERAKDRLLEQYKDKPTINAILTAFVDEVQEIEDSLQVMGTTRDVFNAIGQQLDNIGEIIGRARVNGQSDDDYRADIFVQIAINTAQGEPEGLIKLLSNLSGATVVRYRNLGNATMSFEIDVMIPEGERAALITRLHKAALAGARIDNLTYVTSDGTFSFEGNDSPTTSLGFGDLNDAGVGGTWAEVMTF